MADQDALDAARRLADSLDGVRRELREVKEQGRRNRHLIWGLAVSLLLDVTLTVVVALVAVQAHSASSTASQAYASNQALCTATNTARVQQVELWTYLLNLTKGPETPAEKKVIGEFTAYLHKVFAPRDCARLGKSGFSSN
jgi:hypothetical protein